MIFQQVWTQKIWPLCLSHAFSQKKENKGNRKSVTQIIDLLGECFSIDFANASADSYTY
ncbi:unnamed protein product [Larinioides sclopetarius]|uniref:Uncharacterized protein n=1 Tax=Larinioides sclopetarius TaxID=280406 RepID=A0AAV2BS97_9ARAC